MAYINITSGAYPLSAADIRAEHPNTSFPAEVAGFEEAIAEMGYAVVQPTPQPAVTYTQNISEGVPKKSKSGYSQTWVVSDASAEEVTERTDDEAASVRQDRNQRLADCDWTQLPDAPVDATVWAAYRQALRDVTDQSGFPWEITWPSEP